MARGVILAGSSRVIWNLLGNTPDETPPFSVKAQQIVQPSPRHAYAGTSLTKERSLSAGCSSSTQEYGDCNVICANCPPTGGYSGRMGADLDCRKSSTASTQRSQPVAHAGLSPLVNHWRVTAESVDQAQQGRLPLRLRLALTNVGIDRFVVLAHTSIVLKARCSQRYTTRCTGQGNMAKRRVQVVRKTLVTWGGRLPSTRILPQIRCSTPRRAHRSGSISSIRLAHCHMVPA